MAEWNHICRTPGPTSVWPLAFASVPEGSLDIVHERLRMLCATPDRLEGLRVKGYVASQSRPIVVQNQAHVVVVRQSRPTLQGNAQLCEPPTFDFLVVTLLLDCYEVTLQAPLHQCEDQENEESRNGNPVARFDGPKIVHEACTVRPRRVAGPLWQSTSCFVQQTCSKKKETVSISVQLCPTEKGL